MIGYDANLNEKNNTQPRRAFMGFKKKKRKEKKILSEFQGFKEQFEGVKIILKKITKFRKKKVERKRIICHVNFHQINYFKCNISRNFKFKLKNL